MTSGGPKLTANGDTVVTGMRSVSKYSIVSLDTLHVILEMASDVVH